MHEALERRGEAEGVEALDEIAERQVGRLERLPERNEEVPEGEPVILDQPTVEYAAPPEPGSEGDDVLEETPDFLQETPEHDRLWFEQKPPRDFDLDR